ncbi:MAG: adenylate/guanylate cyclase domain-containing protein [Magnetococcales bacterium]|nr:adenylate/guanylate cyclase domain-containing protein [Magnetococcales bacterium]NGZ25768.1 adenylate/guanylate cyclase domain-containing protein [Magnetococcales bacterium]
MREINNLAIMFADISGSTRLYETLGDERARDLTSRVINLMSRITKDYRGRVVKTIGDEVMCTFPTANDAADAALQMQEDVSNPANTMGTKLSIRVGFHYGEVIEEGGDVFGDAVNLAARMGGQAKAEQIITTGEAVELMRPDLKENCRLVITTTVKGKTKPVEIYELTWGEEEDLTIMGGLTQKIAPANIPSGTLKIVHQDIKLEVGPDLPSITMGRGNQNNVMVADTMASRVHVKIEYRRGKFILVDQSTNGTYVTASQGKRSFVHREEFPLEGDGVIGLGKAVQPNMPEAVHFSEK